MVGGVREGDPQGVKVRWSHSVVVCVVNEGGEGGGGGGGRRRGCKEDGGQYSWEMEENDMGKRRDRVV